MRDAHLSCVHLDVFHKAATLERQLGSELTARGFRVLPALSPLWRVSLPTVPESTGTFGANKKDIAAPWASMKANLARLFVARHSALLVLELGSLCQFPMPIKARPDVVLVAATRLAQLLECIPYCTAHVVIIRAAPSRITRLAHRSFCTAVTT